MTMEATGTAGLRYNCVLSGHGRTRTSTVPTWTGRAESAKPARSVSTQPVVGQLRDLYGAFWAQWTFPKKIEKTQFGFNHRSHASSHAPHCCPIGYKAFFRPGSRNSVREIDLELRAGRKPDPPCRRRASRAPQLRLLFFFGGEVSPRKTCL